VTPINAPACRRSMRWVTVTVAIKPHAPRGVVRAGPSPTRLRQQALAQVDHRHWLASAVFSQPCSSRRLALSEEQAIEAAIGADGAQGGTGPRFPAMTQPCRPRGPRWAVSLVCGQPPTGKVIGALTWWAEHAAEIIQMTAIANPAWAPPQADFDRTNGAAPLRRRRVRERNAQLKNAQLRPAGPWLGSRAPASDQNR